MSIFLDFLENKAKKKKTNSKDYLLKIISNNDVSMNTLVTHVGKFAHPDTNVFLNVPMDKNIKNLGYVYTANTKHTQDVVYTSSSLMPPGILLKLVLENGKNFYQNILDDNTELKNDIESLGVEYSRVKAKMMTCNKNYSTETDRRLKQVYFPIADNKYNIFTIVPSASLLQEFYTRINSINGERKKSNYSESAKYRSPFRSLPNTTEIKFGGANARNISGYNSERYRGSKLLIATPPNLERRNMTYPRTDFFSDTLYKKNFEEEITALGKLFSADYTNKNIRDGVCIHTINIIFKVLESVNTLRGLPIGWTDRTNLPKSQKIWLDNKYIDVRKDKYSIDKTICSLSKQFARWIVNTFNDCAKKDQKVQFSDTELNYFIKKVKLVIATQRGELK